VFNGGPMFVGAQTVKSACATGIPRPERKKSPTSDAESKGVSIIFMSHLSFFSMCERGSCFMV
jgi:hypothetical protein